MDVVMIYFYSKRFRFAPSFNYCEIWLRLPKRYDLIPDTYLCTFHLSHFDLKGPNWGNVWGVFHLPPCVGWRRLNVVVWGKDVCTTSKCCRRPPRTSCKPQGIIIPNWFEQQQQQALVSVKSSEREAGGTLHTLLVLLIFIPISLNICKMKSPL